jgi:hypothetical protein
MKLTKEEKIYNNIQILNNVLKKEKDLGIWKQFDSEQTAVIETALSNLKTEYNKTKKYR